MFRKPFTGGALLVVLCLSVSSRALAQAPDAGALLEKTGIKGGGYAWSSGRRMRSWQAH
jgi:hypothetical protein